MKKTGLYILLLTALCLCACSIQKDNGKKIRDISSTVIDTEDVPEELKAQIEEKKTKDFRITYADKGDLYIVRGYGKKNTSGYSVEVTDCYETEKTICIVTNLLGPGKGEEIAKKATYPYVVIKMKYIDKYVVFK